MSSLKFIVDEANAKPTEDLPDDLEVIELDLGEHHFRVRKPTTDQMLGLTLIGRNVTQRTLLTHALSFMEGIMLDGKYQEFLDMVIAGTITSSLLIGGDDRNEQGIVQGIIQAAAKGNPTKPSTDSATSQKNGGKRSTGRAPGKGSKLAPSAPTAS